MSHYILIFPFLIVSFSSLSQTNDKDSTAKDIFEDKSGTEIIITYEYLNKSVNAFTDANTLVFHNAFHWVGYEQNYTTQYLKGFTERFYFKGLFSNSTFRLNQEYKLKGFRIGADSGYKFLFWDWLVLEPMVNMQFCSLRIKDKLTDSKLKHNGFLLGSEMNFRVILKKLFIIGVSGGYLWDITSKNWKESKNFNSIISADPLNLNGLYLSLKIGFAGHNI